MRGDAFFVEVAKRPPFTKLHPRVAGFFKDYFAHEKVIPFGRQQVVNTHFPPYPSRAFEHLAEGFAALGDASHRRLYSVTLAVTNRCPFRCWHCYNAGRNQDDVPLDVLQRLAGELQQLGAVIVTLTGGEPLLRDDLDRIADAFDDRSTLILGTTGAGLSAERVRRLRDAGLFAVGISLDAVDPQEHDRLRGREGAFRTALDALRVAGQAGLYPYVVTMATHEMLEADRFIEFLRFAGECGALEVHLLEPSATGRLAGRTDVLLSESERQRILELQTLVAEDDGLPILSSYTHLEARDSFGCGAGLTHLYVDGSGEVFPCQLVPLSFGNVVREPLATILGRMAEQFCRPRAECVGHLLANRLANGRCHTDPAESAAVCREHLPAEHPLPRFFEVRLQARDEVGGEELRTAYDRVHGDYDGFWLSRAAAAIDELVERLGPARVKTAFEAGCGSGYATALLADRADDVLAVDISEGMLREARRRLEARGTTNVRLMAGDALDVLGHAGPFDLVFSSWVLGYIRLAPFFAAARRALAPGGRLAFVVHKENSPRRPMELFAELVARDPSVLGKRVAFDFPRDPAHVESELSAAGLVTRDLWQGAAVFHYATADEVLEHLLKSGAGTAFHDAIDPAVREPLTQEFLHRLTAEQPPGTGFEVPHEFIACIAERP